MMWRKIIYLASLCLCLSLLLTDAAMASQEVKPLLSVNVPMARYGIQWQITQTRLLVKNISYVKELTLVFKQSDGHVERVAAEYFGPANDGYEIWEAYSNIPSGETRYSIEYKVDGQNFVDDNSGNDYPLEIGPLFYQDQAISQVLSGKEFYDAYASFSTMVASNLGSDKKVTLHYSLDDWKSVQSLPMQMQSQYIYGYGIIQSPSAHNTELFFVSMGNLSDDIQNIRYYFSYEVDGKTYYDNNYGFDYLMPRAKTKNNISNQGQR